MKEMSKMSKQPYFYLVLSIISLFGASGIFDIPVLGRYSSIVMRLWSLYHLYLICNKGYFKGPIMYFSIFVFALIAYSILPTIHGDTYEIGNSTLTASNYLNNTWMYASPVFTFYWFTKKGLIDQKFIRRITICGVIYSVALFILINSRFISVQGSLGNANNSSYVFLQLIPLLVFFSNRKNIQYVLLFLVFGAIVISSKRGALLITLVCLFAFFSSKLNMSNKRDRNRIITLAILTFVIYAGFLYYEYTHNNYFNERMESIFEKDSSGREEYYATLWYYYNSFFSLTEKIFGRGLYASVAIVGNYAHNDWLEYLVSFGLFGCLLYVIYYISLFRFYFKTKYINNEQSHSLLITIIILFMSTLFSMSFTGMTVFISCSLGYSISYLELIVSRRNVNQLIR